MLCVRLFYKSVISISQKLITGSERSDEGPRLYTLHFTLYTLHQNKVQSEAMKVPAFTLYTLHPTLKRGFAALLPSVSIVTWSEPDRNLIGTSPKELRRISEGYITFRTARQGA